MIMCLKIGLGDMYRIHLVVDIKKAPGFYENGNGPLGFSKNGEFFDRLRKYALT